MADDAIFDTQPAQQAAEPTAADLTNQLARGIQQAMAPLHQQQQALAQQLGTLEQRLAQSIPQGPPTNKANPTTLDRIVEDPDKVLAEERAKAVQEANQGMLPLALELRGARIDKAKTRVVARYGEKAWTEDVQPRLVSILEDVQRTNPSAAINPSNIDYMVNNILGSEELADKLVGHQKTLAEEASKMQRQRPPSFVGSPGRQDYREASDYVDVTPEDKEFLDRLARSGVRHKFTEADYKVARGQPKDVEARYEAEMTARAANQQPGGGRRR